MLQSTKNPQVPDGDLAIARLEVTLSNVELIVPPGGSFLEQIRNGLATSFRVLSLSLYFLVVGICALGPWAILLYGVYRLGMWLWGRSGSATTEARV